MKYHLPLTIMLFTGFVAGAQPVWQPDLFCVRFTVRSLAGDVSGTIGGLTGKLMIDPVRPEKSWLFARVTPQTITTGNSVRDKHLRRTDYFSATAYPCITIASVGIRRVRADSYTAMCDLTIKGTTRRVDIPFTFTRLDKRGAFAGTFIVNRIDYNLGRSTMLLANRVTICVTVDGEVTDVPSKPSDLAAR